MVYKQTKTAYISITKWQVDNCNTTCNQATTLVASSGMQLTTVTPLRENIKATVPDKLQPIQVFFHTFFF